MAFSKLRCAMSFGPHTPSSMPGAAGSAAYCSVHSADISAAFSGVLPLLATSQEGQLGAPWPRELGRGAHAAAAAHRPRGGRYAYPKRGGPSATAANLAACASGQEPAAEVGDAYEFAVSFFASRGACISAGGFLAQRRLTRVH